MATESVSPTAGLALSSTTLPSEKKRKRVWVQNVAVNADALETRLRAIRTSTQPDPRAVELLDGADRMIRQARDAAFGDNPIPTRISNWWRGTLIEASYQNLHGAEAILARLYSDAEVDAEVPEAVARVELALSRDDPRRISAAKLVSMAAGTARRELLSKVIDVGHAAADQEHAKLRSFRNLILGVTALLAVFVALFVAGVASFPSAVPLCFQPQRPGGPLYCPTGSGAANGSGAPSTGDVLVIGLLGLLGAIIAAAVSIRNLRGTATPYEVPGALALLKIPFGVLTAIGGILAIRGDFVPGLSALDSQSQILAYALVFGYAQQLLTGLIDHQAGEILSRLPTKDKSTVRPQTSIASG